MMNQFIRKPMIAAIALTATLATPLAFAQSAPAQGGAMQSPPPAAAEPAAASQKQVTWADLDTDKDGSLSKAEVATVPSLTQAFDQADADKNGKLTADEYKSYAAKTSAGGTGSASGG